MNLSVDQILYTADIPVLADVLSLPDTLNCHQRKEAKKLDAVYVYFYGIWLFHVNMIQMFVRSVPELYKISILPRTQTNRMETKLHEPGKSLNLCLIYRKGAAHSNCFGFVDGTVLRRPIALQCMVHNGHNRNLRC